MHNDETTATRHFYDRISAAYDLLADAGFTISHRESVTIWSMPVAILVGK